MANKSPVMTVIFYFVYEDPLGIQQLYIGCYKDIVKSRDLDNRPYMGPNNSPFTCQKRCINLGYNYFGLQVWYVYP